MGMVVVADAPPLATVKGQVAAVPVLRGMSWALAPVSKFNPVKVMVAGLSLWASEDGETPLRVGVLVETVNGKAADVSGPLLTTTSW